MMEPVKDKVWLKDRMKFVTGHCNEYGKPGQHEGQRPLSSSGKPMRTCEYYLTCPCKCHKDIDELYEMTGRERVLITNPDYASEPSGFVMPVRGVDYDVPVALDPAGAMTPLDGEYVPTPSPAPATAPLAARRTDTGRAARGGLEAQVWEALHSDKIKLMLTIEADVTPKVLAEWIAEKYTIPTPSSGAIAAVWDRWERDGFASQAKKPVRFVKFDGDSSWESLQRIKSSKRTAKHSAATKDRLSLRPRA